MMSDNKVKKFLHSDPVHNLGHKAAHHLGTEGLKYVQGPQFQRQLHQVGQALLRMFR
jgi:hypothetical protein